MGKLRQYIINNMPTNIEIILYNPYDTIKYNPINAFWDVILIILIIYLILAKKKINLQLE
jgi:hypothetical protein